MKKALLFVTLGLVFLLASCSSPKSVVEKWASAIEAGDSAKAESLCDGKQTVEATKFMVEAFKKASDKDKEEFKNRVITADDKDNDGERAAVSLKVGKEERVILVGKKKDGWKITSFGLEL